MKKKRGIIMLCLLLYCGIHTWALEGAELKELVYLPPDFYVGDRVEMRALISPNPGMRLLPPREIPVVSWIEIHDVQLTSDSSNWEIRIVFTPYAAGTRTFPSTVFGDVVFSDVKLHTKSILQERELDFFGIKGQLFLPGTKIALAAVVSVLLFGPLLLFGLTGRVNRSVRRLITVHAGRRPYKRFNRVLRDLREKNIHMSSRRFYIILSEEFRAYLSSRTNQDFLTITSSEIGEQLSRAFPVRKKEQIEELVMMMQQGDLIKFGGMNATKKQREFDLRIVTDISRELETYLENERQSSARPSGPRGRTKKV